MHFTLADKTLIPQPLLPKREKGSRIQSPSPSLGEGFRVRAHESGMLPLYELAPGHLAATSLVLLGILGARLSFVQVP
jgi:hypothetical protein